MLRTGCQWRLLPREFPRPGTVYHYFRAWKDAGVLAELQRALHEQARLKPRPLALPFGGHPGQSVGQDNRARRHPWFRWAQNWSKGANATCSWTPWGWWWPVGSKPPMCRTRRVGARLLAGLHSGFPRIRTVMADAGYESRKLARELKRRHGWRLHITKRRQRAFKVVGLTWIVERTFAWLARNRRLSKDYELKVQTSEAFIDLTAIRLMLKRLAPR